MSKCKTQRRGFTLLEALLVIALIAVLAAFAWPTFTASRDADRVYESARRMKSMVALLRAQAMNESRVYRLVFLPDGQLIATRQLDPLYAPDTYVRFDALWKVGKILLEDVWVESVLPLPEGPLPLIVEDDEIDFEVEREEELEFTPIDELPLLYPLEFYPDGTSNSARWILRDKRGTGLQMRLDGRLGRVAMLDPMHVEADEVDPPLDDAFDLEELPREDEFTLEDSPWRPGNR